VLQQGAFLQQGCSQQKMVILNKKRGILFVLWVLLGKKGAKSSFGQNILYP
jgi:hypothetical protein